MSVSDAADRGLMKGCVLAVVVVVAVGPGRSS